MKKQTWLIAAIIGCIVLAGCTNQVRPTVDLSSFPTNETKLPKTVAVYFTEEFRTYAPVHTDIMDMKKWQLYIGRMTADAFVLAYASRFQKAIIRPGMPEFPIKGEKVDLVVMPKFTYFNAGEPVVARRFENFWVEVAISTVICDPSGKTISTVDLQQKGEKNGLAGGGFAAYPEACTQAVVPIVNETVERTVQLVGSVSLH